ncbi:ras GEF [Rozella allomycis CSF55]|uniref:Ras GEF n=1 Tax=Rozella allomycis (strain CSF55) TaxID=988480 RepID=A0A4P9YQ98_ROZAC|nr:ras GEF [Rozella allomycis CSF55]
MSIIDGYECNKANVFDFDDKNNYRNVYINMGPVAIEDVDMLWFERSNAENMSFSLPKATRHEALIYLTSAVKAFFSRMTDYVSSDELLDCIIQRLRWAYSAPDKRKDIFKKIFVIVRYWLANRYERDFTDNLTNRLLSLIDNLLVHEKYRKYINIFHAHSIKYFLENKGRDTAVRRDSLMDLGFHALEIPLMGDENLRIQSPIIDYRQMMPVGIKLKKFISEGLSRLQNDINPEKTDKLLKYSSSEFAEQLTLIERTLMIQIKSDEFDSLGWLSESKIQKSPNILNYINHFNTMAAWVVYEISNQKDKRNQFLIFSKICRIAYKCLLLKNYSGAAELVAGLNSHEIDKLRKEWQNLRIYEQGILSLLQGILDPSNNFKRLREPLNQIIMSRQPHIPVLERTKLKDTAPDIINFDLAKQEATVKRKTFLVHNTNYDKIIKRNDSLAYFIEYWIPRYAKTLNRVKQPIKEQPPEILTELDNNKNYLSSYLR